MIQQDIDRLATILDKSRSNAHLAEDLQRVPLPATIEDAYAVQAAIAGRGKTVAGWKIAGIVPEQQTKLNIDRAIAAPIFADFVSASPAQLESRRFVTPALECEFAFVLARDLPP